MTHWASKEDFDAWVASADFGKGHAGNEGQAPVASGSALLEFDVVSSTSPD